MANEEENKKGQIKTKKEKVSESIKKNLDKYISAAEDFNELFAVLDKVSGIKGSKLFFESAKLKEIINKVREGELDIDYVTRTAGLRKRVDHLLRWERIRKAVKEKK